MMRAPSPAAELNRLRWQCRRGMRELDLLLLHFVEHRYAELEPPAAVAFARLLDSPDAVLLEWLLGRQIPSDKEVADVVRLIRSRPAP